MPYSDERAELKATLARAGVRPSRLLGQTFLVDPFVADAEAALVGTEPGVPVVEIGGGLGALTRALLRRGVTPLTVIERDRRLAEFLRREFPDRITLLEEDALTANWPSAEVVVGNLPFSVATPLLVRALRLRVPRIVAMVQAEVADRLLAPPGTGEYGRLTILAALHARVEGFLPVPAVSFEPIPAVDGRVLLLTHRPGKLPVPDEEAFEELTRRLFSSRRKQLKNLLPKALPKGADAGKAAGAADWPSDWARRRPEELPPEAYFRMATVVAEL